MILLSDFGDLGQWFQGAIALGALIMSIVVYFQNQKIKSLTNVVEELAAQTTELGKHTEQLKKQAEISEKRFELENILTLKERIPYFIKHGKYEQIAPFISKLVLVNDGKPASDISYSIPHYGEFFEIQMTASQEVIKTHTISFDIFSIQNLQMDQIALIYITLKFSSPEGDLLYQNIFIFVGSVSITPPLRQKFGTGNVQDDINFFTSLK